MVAERIKLQSFLRFQEQLRVRKDGNRIGIVYIHYMYTEWQSGKWIEQGGEDTGAIKTKKMEGKSNQTERH